MSNILYSGCSLGYVKSALPLLDRIDARHRWHVVILYHDGGTFVCIMEMHLVMSFVWDQNASCALKNLACLDLGPRPASASFSHSPPLDLGCAALDTRTGIDAICLAKVKGSTSAYLSLPRSAKNTYLHVGQSLSHSLYRFLPMQR